MCNRCGRTPEVQLLGNGEKVAQLTQLHAASVEQQEVRPIN